jgi:hypothetical protein
MTVREISPAARAAHARRRRLEREYYLLDAVADFGYDGVAAIIEAFRDDSEGPLARLPAKWRDKAISTFREQKWRTAKVVRLPLR